MTRQSDIFIKNKSQEEIKILESKKILMSYGYKVIDPLEVNKSVTNIPELRKYFYARLWNKYPVRMQYYTQHPKEEMRVLREFVESREFNTNRNSAIQECVAIIDTLFDYEDNFRLEKPITDVMIFRIGWIISLAISIMNLNKERDNEVILNKIMEKFEDEYMEKEYTSVLKDKSKKLGKMLNEE